ncbi:hypothetical protein BKA70DRAFT_1307804 [Coprinopsis sp. MPI-PUGE-AT-0042]|nr:hypothetical protein BKA70DRAFT_1307804 [Coprinopsis sp. MPI-PUGE-AT-0042]
MVSARSTGNGKTRTSRASNGSPAKSKSTNKRKAKDYEDSDALDDSEEDEEEGVKPKKRAARTSVGSTTRKKRKVSPSEGDEEEEEETKAKAKAKNGKNPSKGKIKVYESDALDEDTDNYEDDEEEDAKPKAKRRAPAKAKTTPRKKKAKKEETDEDEYEDDEEVGNLKEGQMVVGKVVQAPTTGLVPPGQISNNTLKFLTHLKDPKCNDREWFRLHEPVYRVAEQEWKDFVESFTDVLVEVDPQVPHLPTKDVIHRIYRDVRFSNDKTPYKRGFSGTFSRGGRKGIFAVKPGNESMIAAGLWCPGKNELANLRTNLQRDSRRLRRVISAPQFVKYFGKAERHPKGQRQNIFGHEDELKVAPKGVAKDHKDIDLLKCRTFAVVHRFMDSEVLDPDFKHKLGEVAKVMRPFVYTLNDLVTIGGGGGGGDSDDNDEEGEGEEEEEPMEEEGDEGEEEGEEDS